MSQHVPYLSLWLVDVPTEMLKIFDEVAMTIVLSMFPEYSRIHKEVHVRISDLPLHDSLRDLRFEVFSVLLCLTAFFLTFLKASPFR